MYLSFRALSAGYADKARVSIEKQHVNLDFGFFKVVKYGFYNSFNIMDVMILRLL